MKISDKPTSVVLFKARTQSEWDTVNYCVKIIDKTEHQKLQQKLDLFNRVHPELKNGEFLNLSFWSYVDYWINDDIKVDNDVYIDELFDKNDYLYLEAEQEELEQLQAPESQIDCMNITFFSPTSAYFPGSGKHSGEWYESGSFNITQLLTELKELYGELV